MKKINNTYGHSAGDKLLRLAEICIDYSFGKYGKVYRYGGDEFIALIYVDSRKINLILDKFKKKIAAENREFKYELSIACGFASHAENKNLTIDKLIQTADKKTYIEKRAIIKTRVICLTELNSGIFFLLFFIFFIQRRIYEIECCFGKILRK